MWYVLAAANALSGDSELIAGTQLRVPEVGVSKNDASTFKPYNPNEIVGSTSPGLPYIPPPASLSCKQTMILVATTIVRVVATFYGGVGGAMLADALMQKVEINAGIRSKYSLGETVAAGVFAFFAPAIQGAAGWARAGYAAVAAATAYTGSYLVDKARGADVHFNWSNLAASVVTSMISTKLGAVGNTGVAAGGTVSSTLNSAAFSWAKVASDAVKNLAISVVNKGVTQLITGDKAQWDAGAMFADSFGNALGSAIAVKLNQKILSYDERRSLKAMSPQAQNEYKANRAQGMSSRQAFDYVTNAGGLRAMGDQLIASFGAQDESEDYYDSTQHIKNSEAPKQPVVSVHEFSKDQLKEELFEYVNRPYTSYGDGYDMVDSRDYDGMHRDAGAKTHVNRVDDNLHIYLSKSDLPILNEGTFNLNPDGSWTSIRDSYSEIKYFSHQEERLGEIIWLTEEDIPLNLGELITAGRRTVKSTLMGIVVDALSPSMRIGKQPVYTADVFKIGYERVQVQSADSPGADYKEVVKPYSDYYMTYERLVVVDYSKIIRYERVVDIGYGE